jgi:hypothetical protein
LGSVPIHHGTIDVPIIVVQFHSFFLTVPSGTNSADNLDGMQGQTPPHAQNEWYDLRHEDFTSQEDED